MAITPTSSLLQAIAEHAHRAVGGPAPPRPAPPATATEPVQRPPAASQGSRADGAAAAPGGADAAATTPRRDVPRGSIIDIIA